MPPGSHLGRYRILQELGRGVMAVVFRAHDPSLDREVAIKVLPSYHTEDPTFQERFTREAQAVARLSHPNILQVYDFGEDKGFTYIVTEYVPGGTLEDKFHGEPLSEEETLKFMRPLGEALDYAHSQGILHRDLKPANVLLDAQSRPILGDFGLARLLETSSRSTQAQQVLGTPVYMSPEQALGGDVDHRSDLYAFGVMFYEMLVGRTPFRGDSLTAMLMAHVHEPVPLPTSLNPDFDRGLEAVLLQALAKDPGARYQSAAEMVEALERSVGKVPVEDIQAAAQATMVRTVKPSTGVAPSRRRWVLAGVGVGLAVAVGVAMVAINQLGGDDEPAGATAAEAQPEATAVSAVTAVTAGTATPALSLAEAVAFLEETQVRIAEGVTTLRQLFPQQDIDVKLRTRAQLAELAEGYFRRQYVRDQVFGTEELYKTLGLIQEEGNLQQVIEGILLQQVVALFDDEGEVLYVPSDAAAFGAVEELGYASAYMAGLQQQLFNVSELRRQAREEANFDQYRAVTAFMGGEVSVIREGFISTFFSEEKVAELNRPLPDNLLASAPAVVRKAALFPQVEGTRLRGLHLCVREQLGGRELGIFEASGVYRADSPPRQVSGRGGASGTHYSRPGERLG